MPATGAEIPPEVIVNILLYVGTNPYGASWERSWWRTEGRPDLQRCALVCLYWANKCRTYLFVRRMLWRGSHVTPRALVELEELEFYAVRGSTRLEPLKDLLSGWSIEQRWDARSWCYRRYWSPFQTRNVKTNGRTLILPGPVPPSLPLSALHSPHWSVPKALPSCFTPFTTVRLSDVHFPSFSSLLRLITNFRAAESITLDRVTWGQSESATSVRIAPGITLQYVSATGCTDNYAACIEILRAMGSTFRFHHLRRAEQEACIGLAAGAWLPVDASSPPDQRKGVECSEMWITADRCFSKNAFRVISRVGRPGLPYPNVHVSLNVACAPDAVQDGSTLARVVGLSLQTSPPPYLPDPDFTAVDIELHSCVQSVIQVLPATHAVLLCFETPSHMQDVIAAHPSLREPLSSTIDVTYWFISSRGENNWFEEVPRSTEFLGMDNVAIVPFNMVPTGESWGCLENTLTKVLQKHHPDVPLMEAIIDWQLLT